MGCRVQVGKEGPNKKPHHHADAEFTFVNRKMRRHVLLHSIHRAVRVFSLSLPKGVPYFLFGLHAAGLHRDNAAVKCILTHTGFPAFTRICQSLCHHRSGPVRPPPLSTGLHWVPHTLLSPTCGIRSQYHLVATLSARSFRSLGLSPSWAVTWVSRWCSLANT